MSAALQIVDERPQYDRAQLDLLKRTIAQGLDDNEFALLVEVARRTGLDLFQRQLYGIKRGGKMTLQTGIDGYRALASRTGLLAGIDDAIFDDEDAPHPMRATVSVWRIVQGERCPFTATARWGEYFQPNGGMWQKMPYLMLAKCAEALALRKAFPAELSGVYTGEEMQQADVVDQASPVAAERDTRPSSTSSAPTSVLAQFRDDHLSLQRLYERSRALGLKMSEWTQIKRECGGDLARIAKHLNDMTPDADEDADASGEAALEEQGYGDDS